MPLVIPLSPGQARFNETDQLMTPSSLSEPPRAAGRSVLPCPGRSAKRAGQNMGEGLVGFAGRRQGAHTLMPGVQQDYIKRSHRLHPHHFWHALFPAQGLAGGAFTVQPATTGALFKRSGRR